MAKKRPPRTPQKCALKSCGKVFIPKGSQKYCCDQCRDKQTAINKKSYKSVSNKSWRQEHKPKPKPKKQLSDSEKQRLDDKQKKIDGAVDKRYAVVMKARSITGAEFTELAQMYQDRELREYKTLQYYYNN